MQITKTVQTIGNGGHIYLPRGMVGHKVVVSLTAKTVDEIKDEIIGLLKPHLKHIMGIFLYGSYARGEEAPESDIDILVITDGHVNIKKKIGNYGIMAISLMNLKKTIASNAVLVLPILKESIPIINESLIFDMKKERLNKSNTKWYIESTETSLKLAKEWIKDKDLKRLIELVYPLILRLRGIYMIDCLLNNKEYSNNSIDKYLIQGGLTSNKISQINRVYRELREKNKISPNEITNEDIKLLYRATSQYYQKVREQWEKLK